MIIDVFERKKRIDMDKHTTISIIGQKGTGKTILLQLIFNKINKSAILIDVTGACDKVNALKIKNLSSDNLKEKIKIISELVSKMKNKKMFKMVIDFSTLEKEHYKIVIDAIAQILLKYKIECAFMVDEAKDFLQQGKGRYYSNKLEMLWRIGRNYNIKPVILTSQRATYVDKDVLALSDLYIFFRQMHVLDRRRVGELTGYDSRTFQNKYGRFLMHLNIREVLVFDGANVDFDRVIKV